MKDTGSFNIFNNDFRDFIEALNKMQVEYMLVGGYSVIIYGYHRTTGDMDIWVKPSMLNFDKLMSAFSHFGLPTTAIDLETFLNTGENDVFTFGRPPLAIDILTTVKGLNFDDAFVNAETYTIADLVVKVIHLNDLKVAKKSAGRHKDLDDLEHLP